MPQISSNQPGCAEDIAVSDVLGVSPTISLTKQRSIKRGSWMIDSSVDHLAQGATASKSALTCLFHQCNWTRDRIGSSFTTRHQVARWELDTDKVPDIIQNRKHALGWLERAPAWHEGRGPRQKGVSCAEAQRMDEQCGFIPRGFIGHVQWEV